jgi:putative Mg2+ transporter-C (MgtC) family protein
MEIFWSELSAGIPDGRQLGVIMIRLIAAVLMGALIGLERETAGRTAGLRTHILVASGTAVLVLATLGAGMGVDSDAMSRVMQGIITGIGFVGAGSILKRAKADEIEGVTTSAAIWMTAAIGVTVGLGGLGLALIATALSLIVLRVLAMFQERVLKEKK